MKECIRKSSVAAVFAAMLLILAVSLPCVAQEQGAADMNMPEVATPSVSNTDEYTDTGIVPDDVTTQEDFMNDVFEERQGATAGVSFWRVLGSLAIIIVLILGAVYVMRLFLARGMRYDLKGRHIRVLDVVQLGMNRSLYLVAVGNRIVLLGSSDKGLTFLMEAGSGGDLGEELENFASGKGVEFHQNLEDAASNTAFEQPGQPGSTASGEFMEKVKDKLRKLEEDRRRE